MPRANLRVAEHVRFLREKHGAKFPFVYRVHEKPSEDKTADFTRFVAALGHFGLAFPDYTHFTSPTRRYPDLVVHRLLKTYGQDGPKRFEPAAGLSEICRISTEREILAQNAERESVKVKQVEFMERHLGGEFEGVIAA
jgi:exoribonuclease R